MVSFYGVRPETGRCSAQLKLLGARHERAQASQVDNVQVQRTMRRRPGRESSCADERIRGLEGYLP